MDEFILKNIVSAYGISNRNLDASEEMINAVKRKGFNDVLSNFPPLLVFSTNNRTNKLVFDYQLVTKK